MVPNVGLTAILNRLASQMWLAVGTGSATPAVGDTALGAEIARVAVVSFTVVPYTSITFDGFFSSSKVGGQTLKEAGLFDAEAGGNLISRLLVNPPTGQAIPSGQGAIVSLTLPLARGS